MPCLNSKLYSFQLRMENSMLFFLLYIISSCQVSAWPGRSFKVHQSKSISIMTVMNKESVLDWLLWFHQFGLVYRKSIFLKGWSICWKNNLQKIVFTSKSLLIKGGVSMTLEVIGCPGHNPKEIVLGHTLQVLSKTGRYHIWRFCIMF